MAGDAFIVSTAVIFPSQAPGNAFFVTSDTVFMASLPGNAYFIATDYGTAGPNPAKRHVWDGSQWVRTPEFVWNGTAWQQVF